MSNIQLNVGTGGSVLGTDTVAGIDYQKVKVTFSTDGSVPVSVDATHGLPVSLTGTSAINLTQVAGTALGATAVTNFGTAPAAAAVPGANVSLFSGTTGLTNTGGALDVNVKTPATLAENLTQIAGTVLGVPTNFGTTPGAVVAASANASLFLGTTASVTSAAGVQRVGIAGSSNGVMDSSAAGAGASPANGLQVTSAVLTTAPNVATGNAIALQSDYQGSLFVKPYRRGQTKAQATTIANSSAATTILAAQAAGIFADISTLVITVLATTATAPILFTATLSDGTNSYVFDFSTVNVGVSTTATNPNTGQFVLPLPVPIPATTAATAWTLALSVATVTVHVTCVAVLQKAS